MPPLPRERRHMSLASLGSVGHPCGVPADAGFCPRARAILRFRLRSAIGYKTGFCWHPPASGDFVAGFLLGEPPARVPPMKTVHRTVFISPSCAHYDKKARGRLTPSSCLEISLTAVSDSGTLPYMRGFVCKNKQSCIFDCEVRAGTKPACNGDPRKPFKKGLILNLSCLNQSSPRDL